MKKMFFFGLEHLKSQTEEKGEDKRAPKISIQSLVIEAFFNNNSSRNRSKKTYIPTKKGGKKGG